ncbi:hypothetical protein PC118_g25334 [Phytophthora cactorum]|uniref:Crinkler effector protein N-terminal domain-containing protein n=1 Tax=Phytophthora cactorum TaxID=29920 RepID=A0A8T1EB73_9STRA|nr:hypothetical protein PC118_g25334 [Phytophthora cactorum]
MVLLNCALVGEGSVISIIIEEWKTVALLKKAIKEEKPNDFKDVDADKLQLFLAKTDDGAWLKSKDLLRMRKGEIPNEVESRYMNEELEDPTDKICSNKEPRLHLSPMVVFSITAFIRSSRNSRRLTKLVIGSNFRRCYR